jgi:hypothetical protein
MSSARLLRGATALVTLGVILGGLSLPVLPFAFADEPAPFCGVGGRCCCAGKQDERDGVCLRQSCGCERPSAVALEARPWLEAVLPTALLPTLDEPRVRARRVASSPFLDRSAEPTVPPPRTPQPRPQPA